MKRHLALLVAAPLLLAAACSNDRPPVTADSRATWVVPKDPAVLDVLTLLGGNDGSSAVGNSGTSGTAGNAGSGRCRTKDLKASTGAVEANAGVIYVNLVFTNKSAKPCTMYGFPGVSWVAGDDGHQVNAGFDRTDAAKSTITLAAGGVAHATLATHDVGFFDAAQCKPVAVRGFRIYPPDETKSIFVALTTKACSANGVNKGTVSPVAKGATL